VILAYLPKNFYSKTGVESNTFKFNKINNCFTPPERNRAFNFFIVVDLDMKFALCPVKICCVSRFVVFPDLSRCVAKLRWSLHDKLTPQRHFPSSRPTTISNANYIIWSWSIHKSIFYLNQKCGSLPIYL